MENISTPVTNPALPKVDGTAIAKAVALLGSIVLAGFGVVPVVFGDRQPQTETIAPPSVDPNWLLTPEPAGLPVALEQADLFAEEIHRALVQSEAARMVSQAHSMVGDERFAECYGKSIEDCFDSIEQAIREEWLGAIEHDEKVRVLFRWQALQVARTGNVEPPAMALDGTFLQLSDKLAIERRAAMSSSVEGASRFRQIETQLERLNGNAPVEMPDEGSGESGESGESGDTTSESGESNDSENTAGETEASPDGAIEPEDPDNTTDSEGDAEATGEAPAAEPEATDSRADTNSEVETSTGESSTREDGREQ